MRRFPTTQKRQASKLAAPVPGDATKNSSSKAKADQEKPGSSNQAFKNSTRKRKNRLGKCDHTKQKQFIDLTGGDSDTGPARKKRVASTPSPPSKNTANFESIVESSENGFPAASSAASSPASERTIMGKVLEDISEQRESPSHRVAKRARVDNAPETPMRGATDLVQQYYLLPPAVAADPTMKIPATVHQCPPCRPQFSSADLPFAARSRPIYELEAVAAKAPTPPTTIDTPVERPAPTSSSVTKPATIKPEQIIKSENTLTDGIPSASVEAPTLAEKIKLARELGAALEVSEPEAYRLLMSSGWVEDVAVLAHMGTKVEGGGK